jgi:hypothetical protein
MPKYIRRFPSGAVRSDNRGRERPDYISPYAEKAIGEYFAGNESDFGATNYFLGIPQSSILESLKRHFLDYHISVLENDEASIRKNLQALAANAIMGLHTVEIQRLGIYKEVHEQTEYIETKR